MVTNATIETLLGRRSIRRFTNEAIDDDTIATLETVAQHAASSQFLNDWSAIRVTDPAIKANLATIANQSYIATAPLLYVFVIDEHRNARIAERKGIDPTSDDFHLTYSYRFTQAQNDAVLALHAMETAAYSLDLGCVILGSLLNDIPGLIDLLNLPEYTYPVLGLAIGKPDQNPTIKPRMPRTMQFFENTYPSDADDSLDQLDSFDAEVHNYYDLRQTDRPVDAFSDQIATVSRQDVSRQALPNRDSNWISDSSVTQLVCGVGIHWYSKALDRLGHAHMAGLVGSAKPKPTKPKQAESKPTESKPATLMVVVCRKRGASADCLEHIPARLQTHCAQPRRHCGDVRRGNHPIAIRMVQHSRQLGSVFGHRQPSGGRRQ
jgi:nitroreductase